MPDDARKVPLDENARSATAAAGARRAEVTWPPGFSMRKTGLWWLPDDSSKPAQWLAAPFAVEGEMRGSRGDGWGLLLSWRDRDGRLHRWCVPHRALIGEPGRVEGELADRGLALATGQQQRERLRAGLMGVRCAARVTSVQRAGWHRVVGGSVYLFPNGDATGGVPERVILDCGLAEAAAPDATAGTLANWQSEVAAPAVGNGLLALFLAAAFAGPLLDLTRDPSGGVHLYGRSQAGKTTLLRCAASVWGAPEAGALLRTWRATANGLEAAAVEASDGLLPLDEIGQADGREVAEVVYLLGNEAGKRRANRDGGAREGKTWRLLFLSTGEVSLEAKLAEAGKRTMAGQEVRMVNLQLPPAGPVRGDLHGHPDTAALLAHLNRAAGRNHGTASRAFLGRLAAERGADSAALSARVAGVRAGFLAAHLPAGADGQVAGVARRFALIAAAGELATAFRVLPWAEGEAERAAGACFRAWLARRGGSGAAEDAEAVERVRRFIVANGASRFAALADAPCGGEEEEASPDRPVVGRAGWRRADAEGRWEYLVATQVWDAEVCAGTEPREVARALRARGLLRTESATRLTAKSPRIRGYGRPRIYWVTGAILDDSGERECP
jgi:uncharacterized protein (DUF927 family)